jgi:hypothetical protein
VKEGFVASIVMLVFQLHILKLMKNVRSTGSILEKKYNAQNAVLTEAV